MIEELDKELPALGHPETVRYQTSTLPSPVKRGGLNGSTQHLLKAFLHEPGRLISCTELNSKKTKALFRF